MGKTADVVPGAIDLNKEVPIGEASPSLADKEVQAAPPSAEVKPAAVTYDEFVKVELRVGQVLEAEPVPKSEKLLKLKVDLGESATRQILAGIGKSYAPSLLIGRKFVFVANLPPRKMMGLESNGMILASGPDEAHLTLITPDAPGAFVQNGSRFH